LYELKGNAEHWLRIKKRQAGLVAGRQTEMSKTQHLIDYCRDKLEIFI
jgi:hypothetical protein